MKKYFRLFVAAYVVGFFLLTGYLSDWNPTFGYGAGVMLIIMLINQVQ